MSDYDRTNKESIYEYAKGLEGKSFRNVCDEDSVFLSGTTKHTVRENYKHSYGDRARKGGLGELIEERYFHYSIDNESKPDFVEANVELKVTPYKINKNGSLSAKERLIISMINYMDIVDMDFYSSNAWSKLENVLLIYYLWENEIVDRLDYIISFVYMLSPDKEDIKIIENDFYKIKQKVMDGKAHELSEGDTIYLGAATKSSSSSVTTQQPFSDTRAKPRAFSLKNSYMTYVLRNYISTEVVRNDKIIEEEQLDEDILYDFEETVLNKINKYKGETSEYLIKQFFPKDKMNSKDNLSRLVFEILNVKTKNAEEFEKANIVVKTIRVSRNNKIIESMSFQYFKIKNLVTQDWDKSDVFNFFNETKFLFVVFEENNQNNYTLKGSLFWNMPMSDIEGPLKQDWTQAQNIFKEGVEFNISTNKNIVYNNLPKKSNTKVLHVRPHASKSAYLINGVKYGNGIIGRDTDTLPNGDEMTKQCFWLNNDYVFNQLIKKNK